MKTITLAAALAVTTALAMPAFAAGSDDATKAGTTTQSQTEMQTQANASGKAAGMSGERMDEAKVRELQQALKDAGQDVDVDGVWGDDTAEALRSYQEEEGLTASGELDSETLTALGLDLGTGVDAGVTQSAESPDATNPMPTDKPAGATDESDSMKMEGGTTTEGGSAN